MSEQETTGYPPRLRALIASALALATPVVVGAAVSLALDPPSTAEGLAVLLFLALALLAELKPVPPPLSGRPDRTPPRPHGRPASPSRSTSVPRSPRAGRPAMRARTASR